MIRKLQAIAVLMLMSCYAVAGTVSIGTASSRGGIRVDSYSVKGDATVFDGSVVETGQDGAAVRMPGTTITISQNSKATLYRDRMVLEQGQTESKASSPFKIQADAVRVTPATRDARWTVTVKSKNTVEVAALSGEVGVTNDQGVMLARILPGRALSFESQPGGSSRQFNGTGDLSMRDGHLMLTIPETGQKYEVKVAGAAAHHALGNNVAVNGMIDPNQAPVGGAVAVVATNAWPVAADPGGAGGASAGQEGDDEGTGQHHSRRAAAALIIGGIVVAALASFVGLTLGASTPTTISN